MTDGHDLEPEYEPVAAQAAIERYECVMYLQRHKTLTHVTSYSDRQNAERPFEPQFDPEKMMRGDAYSPSSQTLSRAHSQASSYETNATSLPALQQKGPPDDHDHLQPLTEEDFEPGSFDLVAPVEGLSNKKYSLETRSEQLFSTEHLEIIFKDPSLLLRFTSFLSHHRASSIPILIYYLDAVKALKAIDYANAIAEALEPIPGYDFTTNTTRRTANDVLERKAAQAFEVLVREDLPAYITHIYVQTVSQSIIRRVTGTLPVHLRETSEGLAEVFVLCDPSRPDNPIVFASEGVLDMLDC